MLDAINMDQVLILLTVIGIDLALSADNAVVIGLAAASLPSDQRGRVITVGTIAAALLRITLAIFAVQLLGIIGLIFTGGLLLLYVSWKLWWDLKGHNAENANGGTTTDASATWDNKAFRRAILRIVVADLSMSIENILAVAGAARNHLTIMIAGLVLSIILTGIAANLVTRILDKHRWISYLGVGLIAWVSLNMIWDGSKDLLTHFGLTVPTFPGLS